MKKRNQRAVSPQQRRQRELAWNVYIVEGAIANLSRNFAVNCTTYDDADKKVVDKAVEHLITASEALRKRMQQIR
jgi:hypothetical protein